MTPWPGFDPQGFAEEVLGRSRSADFRIGGRYVHPEDGVIEITSGQYWGDRGLSNHWHWRIVATGEEGYGYGGDWPDAPAFIPEHPTPAQKALLGYMEGASEERWSAGWLTGLHTALLGDSAYEWLVEAAGGWFTGHYPTEFVAGTLAELRALREA